MMTEFKFGNTNICTISPYILVQDVTESKPSTQIMAVGNAVGIGQRVTQNARNYLEVVVHFSIMLLPGNEAQRMQILKAVNDAAMRCTYIQVGYRSGMSLKPVVLAEAATVGNIRKWNDTYQLVFRAYELPYWQKTSITSVSSNGVTTATITMNNGSAVQTPLYGIITNKGTAALTSVKIECGSQKIQLTGLNVATNNSVSITYVNGVIRIMAAGSSVLGNRTADSVDDIWLKYGDNSVKVTCNTTCNIVMRFTERYL